MSSTPIAVFMRAPSSGAVKTRLSATLGASERASLYRAFVADTVATCAAIPALRVELWVAGDVGDAMVRELGAEHAIRAQPEIDLGGRMAAALESMVRGAGRGLVIGTDAPTLPPSHLAAAARALDDAALVLGPSADGGFYLVGARGAVPPVFEGVRYSTRHALDDTLEAARRAAVSPALLPPWYDVDTPEDLRVLRAHLAIAPDLAPRTASFLRFGAFVDTPTPPG